MQNRDRKALQNQTGAGGRRLCLCLSSMLRSLSCADFSADSMVARASNQYDRSGISGLFCRHGVILALLNTGERYKNHAIAWAEEKQELNEELTTWVSKLMSFPLGSFHGPMHNALCQSINSLRSIPEAGLGTGEPPEYAWSHMRRSGHLLQYMSLATRALHLERVALLWNKTRKSNLVQSLVAAYKRADLKYREKTEELRSIMHQAVHMKFSLAQIEEMTSNPPRLDKEVEVARSNEVEFLECTLVYEFIKDSSAILKPFVEILMGDVVANRLSLRSQYARKMKVRTERVKAKLPSNWGSQADIARATYSLWDFKLRRKEQIVVQARQRKYIDQGKKLRMKVDTLAKIARQILRTVHAYYGHLTGTPSIDRGAAAEAIQIAAKISWKSDGSVDSSALYNCIEEDAYPWQHASCSGLERLRAQFHAARDVQCRAMEEKDLVRAEILGAREALEAERQSVREEMARLVEDERRTELLVSDTAFQGMSQSSWESGVALMKSRLGIFENRCSIGALSAIEEEAATLLQELPALHVSDHGVHPTIADGNGHQSYSLSIGDYEDDGMEVEI
eukprot:jgi/Picre1/33440/NNA_008764.t1